MNIFIFCQIYDGSSEFFPQIGKYCELNNTKLTVTSSGPHVWMRFVSDSINNSAPGFELKLSSVKCKLNPR